MGRLHKRKSVYYTILTVPADLQGIFKKRQIWRSTGSQSYKQAKSASIKLAANFDQICVWVRLDMISPALANEMLARYALAVLKTEEHLYGGGSISTFSGDDKQKYLNLQEYENRKFESDRLTAVIDDDKKKLSKPDGDVVRRIATMLLNGKKISADPESPEFLSFSREVMKTKIALNRIRSERLIGEYDSDLQNRKLAEWEAAVPEPIDRGIPVSELIELYQKYRIKGGWTAERVTKKGYNYKRLHEIITKLFSRDIGVRELTDDVAEQIVNKLREYPKVKKAETVRKYVFDWAQPFTWGAEKKQGFLECNPFKGLAPSDDEKESEKRREFNPDELQRYIDLLAAHHDDKFPEMTWIPVLMLFTGLRSNEVAQLFIDNIKTETDIIYFDILTDEDRSQRTKNKKSERKMPIHDKLIEFGLIDFVNRQTELGYEQLFPNVKPDPKTGRHYSSELSIAFNKVIDRISKDKELVLYSLRANFESALEYRFTHAFLDALEGNNNVLQGLEAYANFFDRAKNDLMGHIQKGTTGDRTYRKVRLQIMKRTVEQLIFDIDFTNLKSKLCKTNIGDNPNTF